MRYLTMACIFALVASACFAQVTFSGAIIVGKITNAGGTGSVYEPSTEFSDLALPSGFAPLFDDSVEPIFTLTGNSCDIEVADINFSTPSGDWQLDAKITPTGSTSAGIAVNGWFFGLDTSYSLATGPIFKLSYSEQAESEAIELTSAYLRITNVSGAMTFEYSTDGTNYTELEPDGGETSAPETYQEYGSPAYFGASGDSGNLASFDYIRFTSL